MRCLMESTVSIGAPDVHERILRLTQDDDAAGVEGAPRLGGLDPPGRANEQRRPDADGNPDECRRQ